MTCGKPFRIPQDGNSLTLSRSPSPWAAPNSVPEHHDVDPTLVVDDDSGHPNYRFDHKHLYFESTLQQEPLDIVTAWTERSDSSSSAFSP